MARTKPSPAEPSRLFPGVLSAAGLACASVPASAFLLGLLASPPTTVTLLVVRYRATETGFILPAILLSYLGVLIARKRFAMRWVDLGALAMALIIAVVTSIEYAFIAGACVLMLLAARSAQNISYIEVTIIFLFVGLLSTIASGNQESGFRVRRVQADLRSLQIAIECYHADHNAYPRSTTDPALRAQWKSKSPMPTFAGHVLTTPIGYSPGLPLDPHRFLGESRPYAYYNHMDQNWILIDAGPNCQFELKAEALPELLAQQPDKLFAALGPYTYDPTNGLQSGGDIWKLKVR